ncbi:MAG: SBBP repeat-containing protein [Bryobacteraceae bacterium]
MARRTSAQIFIGFLTIFAAQGALAANSNSTPKSATTNYARPLSFEPNQGQTNKQVDFLAHGDGYSLFLSHAETVMVLQRNAAAKANSHIRPTSVNSTAVRLRPVGGNASAKVDALGQMPGKSNYFTGNAPERWHRDIPNYVQVRYGNVYPGVDMIYYGNQRQLEYDFVVSSGTDPGSISLELEGPSKAELDRDGSIVMHTEAGDLRWQKPVAYQEIDGSRKLVQCAYARSGTDRIRFTIGTYDRTKRLVIDPVLVYSTYLGGSNSDGAGAIAVDARGNAYVTGATASIDFPTKSAFQEVLNAATHAFVTKFDSTGNLVYSTYLGGTFSDGGSGIAVDVHGNAYITGETSSTDFPTKNAFQATNLISIRAPDSDTGFVTKICPAGNALVYSTYLGGSLPQIGEDGQAIFGDTARAIAVDVHGSAYVTGYTFSTDFPTKNAFQPPLVFGSSEAFITKFNAAGSLVYSTYLGGDGATIGSGIAVGVHGEAHITGTTAAPDFPTKNAFQTTLKSSIRNAFVTKLGAAGNALVYSTYLGGSGQEVGNGIAVNAHGQAYVTGYTASIDFPTKNAVQGTVKTSGPFGNAFVTKFNASGDALVYSTYLASENQFVNLFFLQSGIAVDARGQAYVTGLTSSTDFPTKKRVSERAQRRRRRFCHEAVSYRPTGLLELLGRQQ